MSRPCCFSMRTRCHHLQAETTLPVDCPRAIPPRQPDWSWIGSCRATPRPDLTAFRHRNYRDGAVYPFGFQSGVLLPATGKIVALPASQSPLFPDGTPGLSNLPGRATDLQSDRGTRPFTAKSRQKSRPHCTTDELRPGPIRRPGFSRGDGLDLLIHLRMYLQVSAKTI